AGHRPMQYSQLMPHGDVLEADGGSADAQGAKVGPDTKDEDHRRLQGHEVTTSRNSTPKRARVLGRHQPNGIYDRHNHYGRVNMAVNDVGCDEIQAACLEGRWRCRE